MNEELHVGEQFFRIIDEFENAPPDCRQTASGAALDAYLCPSEQWTIGDGCCFWETGEAVKEGDSIPDGPDVEKRLEKLLAYNARYCEEYVREHVTVKLNQHQFDALCSFRFNTRETTLRNSSRLLPAINNQEWQKAALAMTEFVYGSSTYNGKPYQEAMDGILRRRLWESLIFLSYDPVGAVTVKGTALPTSIKLMSSGIYRDVISSEGLTTLNQVRMRAQPLPPPELILTNKAEPAQSVAQGKAGQPEPAPSSVPAAPASVSKPAAPPLSSSGASGPAPPPKPPQGTSVAPVPSTKPAPPVVAGQDGTKPKSPWTVQPEDVHYKLDPGAGLKPLEDSDRAKAFYWQRTFMFVIYLGGAGIFGSTFMAGSTLLMKHAALMSVVLDLIVPLAIALSSLAIGAVGKSWADWRRHRAQQVASQGLY